MTTRISYLMSGLPTNLEDLNPSLYSLLSKEDGRPPVPIYLPARIKLRENKQRPELIKALQIIPGTEAEQDGPGAEVKIKIDGIENAKGQTVDIFGKMYFTPIITDAYLTFLGTYTPAEGTGIFELTFDFEEKSS